MRAAVRMADLHSFSFETCRWESIDAGANAPAPRCAHTCVVYGESLFVFGGYDGRRYFDDCFELALQVRAQPLGIVHMWAGRGTVCTWAGADGQIGT